MGKVLIDTLIRGVSVYILALFLTRLMGRKLVSQMTFFDFIMAVSMGAIIANAVVGQQFTSASAVIAFVILSILTVSLGYLHIKSLRVRKLINSEPVVLVENGTIIEENMKNIKLTINELMMKLREKNAFNLADVEFAIMETDGELSVLPKAEMQPLTPKHMNIQAESSGLTRDIIIDGILLEENLTNAGLDKNWLTAQLNNQNIKDASDVFYAGLDNIKKLHISKKSKSNSEPHGKYGIE